MNAGDITPVTVTMQNTGTESWQPGGNYVLYTLNTPANQWGATQANVTAVTATTQNANLSLTVTAPSTPGTYTSKWQMRKLSGTNAGFFGSIINLSGNGSAGSSNYNAAVNIQTIPSLMTGGRPSPASCTTPQHGC